MLQIKERGNEHYAFSCNNLTNLKILTANGYIKEVGQCLFLYNAQTALWEVYDSRYVHLVIPTYPTHERIWNIFDTKITKLGKKRKPVHRLPPNKIEIARDEIMDAITQVAQNELTYREFYETVKDYFGLKPFIKVKGRDDSFE